MAKSVHDSLIELLRRGLMPFVRMCVRHNVKLVELIMVLKECMVRAAAEELSSKGQSTSASRISVMTGVHRRDTSTILKKGAAPVSGVNLILKLIGYWQQHSSYSDGKGHPKELSCEGRDSEFAKLCRAVSVDLNPYTMLFELERIGAASRTTSGIRLDLQVYGPQEDVQEGFNLLASDVDDLVTSVDENLFARDTNPNLHIRTEYDNIPSSALSEIRQWLLHEGSGFHFRAREFLSKFDRDLASIPESEKGRIRVALGSFSRVKVLEEVEQVP
ncbi:MAG: hypothetical protein K1X79_07020 [Oligoflexia bacterium]|nr:hypothetical protein [Oligoflexia bacterium]